MHADGAVHAIVYDNEDHRGAILCRSSQFLSVHQEVTITREANDGPLRMGDLCSDGGGNSVTHGTVGRRQLRAPSAVLIEALQPAREIAGAVRENRITGQALAQPGDDFTQIDSSR